MATAVIQVMEATAVINEIKDYIKEAVIDIPRRTYAKGVFDEADTDNPKLKDSVKSMIDDLLKKNRRQRRLCYS